ncbi:MAG: hypothetical protein NC419_12765, partial [Muribaculaceae bacterium]|nr:hypothetical protein [Muribaculaceae bacterium]
YRAEVLGMLLEKFDVKKYGRSLRAEGFKDGVEQGFKNGVKQGTKQEAERINKLIIILSEQNRTDDLIRAAQDSEYQEQLFREFGLL